MVVTTSASPAPRSWPGSGHRRALGANLRGCYRHFSARPGDCPQGRSHILVDTKYRSSVSAPRGTSPSSTRCTRRIRAASGWPTPMNSVSPPARNRTTSIRSSSVSTMLRAVVRGEGEPFPLPPDLAVGRRSLHPHLRTAHRPAFSCRRAACRLADRAEPACVACRIDGSWYSPPIHAFNKQYTIFFREIIHVQPTRDCHP